MRDGNFELGALDGHYTFYNNLGKIIQPIEENQLIYKNGRKYKPMKDQPYWGMAFGLYRTGQKLFEVVYEDGFMTGKYHYFNKNIILLCLL